jgi:hypothetical protein
MDLTLYRRPFYSILLFSLSIARGAQKSDLEQLYLARLFSLFCLVNNISVKALQVIG